MEPVSYNKLDPDLPKRFPEVYNDKNLSEPAKFIFSVIYSYITNSREDIPKIIEANFARTKDKMLPDGWELPTNELELAGYLPNKLNIPEVREKNQKKMLLEYLEITRERLLEKFKEEKFDEEDKFLLVSILRHYIHNLNEEQHKLRESGQHAYHLLEEELHLGSVLIGDLDCEIDEDTIIKHPDLHKFKRDARKKEFF